MWRLCNFIAMKYKNILLIDDDEDDREIFLEALKSISEPVNYILSNDVQKAMQQLNDGILEPDLIFLDLQMPKITGQEFLTDIKKIDRLKDIPIIVVSTHSGDVMKQTMLELGAKDYITKPNSFSELVSILQSVL